MKYLRVILFLAIVWIIISWFVYMNQINYKKHIQIRDNYVNHPEGLIKKDVAKLTSFWFASLKANLYWLQTIQYIWWTAASSEYKKYLYEITDITTELNPFFEHPYIITQLLLPGENQRYESLSDDEVNQNTENAILIWLKWIKNFCNESKINNILWQNDLRKIWSEDAYRDPCKSYKIPYYLAYIYYYYKKDPSTASDYYKIASANHDTVKWAKTMAAIMAWKWWNREKSIFMFLNLAESLDQSEDKSCSLFSQELQNLSAGIFLSKEIELTDNIIQSIEETRLKYFWEFSEDDEKQLSETECVNFLNKANRELNLAFIENANNQYKLDNNWENAIDGKELLEKWYIKFLPTDFQQYEDHWIKYQFNEDTGVFDYQMNY